MLMNFKNPRIVGRTADQALVTNRHRDAVANWVSTYAVGPPPIC